MNEKTFSDVDSWLAECVTHPHLLVSSDAPSRLLIGFSCYVCGEVYYIKLSSIQHLPVGHPLRDAIRTAEGRVSLPMTWMRGVVMLSEEWDAGECGVSINFRFILSFTMMFL